MYNSQNPDEIYGYLCNPQQGSMEGFQNTTYTCPEGWNQVAEDSQNGLCRTGCDTFNYGPKYGGYPTNRRPAQTRCVDLRNGSDQSGAWKNRSNTWPPSAQAQVVAPPSNTYDNGVTYKEGDQVSFNGSLYRLNRFIGAAGYAPSNKPQNWDNLTNPALNYKDGQPYSNDILYDAGNTVTLNGTTYKLKEFIGGAGYAPLANPNWVSLNPNYDNGVTYKEGDQVTFNGSLYRLNRFIGAAGYAPSNKPQNWDNLSNPALNYKDGQPYSNDILYDAGNTVTLNGTGYRLKEFIGGAGYAPLANPNWVSLNPVVVPAPPSNYDNGVTYKEGDQVKFNGSLYRLNRFIGAAGYAPSNKPQNWDNLSNPALNYKDGQPYSNDILYDAGNTVTLNGTGYRLKEFIGGAGYAPLANPNWISLNPVGPPIPTSVTVYQHCDKAGWAKSLIGARVFKAGTDFPSDASYIFVPPGFRATIYTGDQTGRSKVINQNEAFVFCDEGSWANDNIRSIVVTSV